MSAFYLFSIQSTNSYSSQAVVISFAYVLNVVLILVLEKRKGRQNQIKGVVAAEESGGESVNQEKGLKSTIVVETKSVKQELS
jgi:hypothetical protein